MTLNLEELTGFSLDIFIAALAAIVVILLIIVIINGVKMTKLKKKISYIYERRKRSVSGRHHIKTYGSD